jgi:hypothetical protein
MTASIAFELFKYLIPHCTKNPIYIFPEMKLRGLVPNSYIHVYVSDLNIPRIRLAYLAAAKRLTYPGNIYQSLTDT